MHLKPNTYATKSFVHVLKMEYVSKINIFDLKMMMKSGPKNIIEIPPCKKAFFTS